MTHPSPVTPAHGGGCPAVPLSGDRFHTDPLGLYRDMRRDRGPVVPVELPDGSSLKVRIPPGAQSGGQLVVNGKGIPGDPPGNLELNLRVVLPPADTPRAKELYETMARDLKFDPRAAGAGSTHA